MNFRTCMLLSLALSTGCAAINNPFSGSNVSAPNEVPAAIEAAEADLAAGRTSAALERLRKAREVHGLSTDVAGRVDVLVERCAEQLVTELSKPGSDPEALADLLDLNLPRQIAITAGVRAARLYLDQGDPMEAYSLIQKVDKKYPPAGTHHEKAAASAILLEGGLQLAQDDSSFLGMFRAKDDAKAVLEYLVLNYPKERRCDEAYAALGKLYEDDGIWATARERHEDLLTYHFESPLAAASEARIPYLRLKALRSPEYDRRELLRARAELEAWLARHPGHELEPAVRLDYADCLQRLVDSDLSVARYYRKVDQAFGARLHAERALAVANQTGDERVIARAKQVLESLP
jgi:outer membrane protein assembly factor BamD (BamD/ComL family)